jgi:hypothetical protein
MKTTWIIATAILALVFPKTYQVAPSATSTVIVPPASNLGQTEVREYVAEQAKLAGINVTDALWVIDHESQDGQNLYGDDGNSLGYFQISTIYQPQVGKECSLSLPCSTAFFISSVKKGNINWWTTFKYRCKWFPKDNPPECK